MYVFQNADTEHTMAVDRVAGRENIAVQVPVVAIDDLLATSAAPVDRIVLKIDVEGYERLVLDGMERTLRRAGRRPDVIMEFLGRAIDTRDH